MARKKPRDKDRSRLAASPATTAAPVINGDNGAAVALTNGEAADRPKSPGPKPARKERERPRTFVEAVAIHISRWLGSLQVAVILLIVFVAVLAIGTMMESWYNAEVAQYLVYRAWWFSLLLFLLAVNIFFAAAKKWPWKKHQTGFLITHLGLLTLISGGILTSLGGTDAVMPLCPAGDDPKVYKMLGIPRQNDQVINRDSPMIKIGWGDEAYEKRFTSGIAAWHKDQYTDAAADNKLVAFLTWLRHPLPKRWDMDMDDQARLEVLNFYPTARVEQFSKGTEGRGNPAFKLQLTSPRAGDLSTWMAFWRDMKATYYFMGPAMVETLGICSEEMLPEFQKPPPGLGAGPKGLLVVHIDGETHRFPVADYLGKPGLVRLGNTGKTIQITKYSPRPGAKPGDDQTPWNPVVEFEVTSAGKTTGYEVMAHLPGVADRVDDGQPADDLRVWYHPPNYRYGLADKVRGLLQFVIVPNPTGEQGTIYYRSFNSEGGFQLESSAAVQPGGKRYNIWRGMDWSFSIPEYFRYAVEIPRFAPETNRPGLMRDDLYTVVRCKLSAKVVRDREGNGIPRKQYESQEFKKSPEYRKGQPYKEAWESTEFWVMQNRKVPKEVQLGGEVFKIDYTAGRTQKLPFELKLNKAERTDHPGTATAATFTSYVELTDAKKDLYGDERVITMNQPLEHGGVNIKIPLFEARINLGGYKVYQTDMGKLRNPETDQIATDSQGREVMQSTFTVGRDPGLPFKYLGSTMLALGIACMFYMRAYFFKPRGRSGAEAPAEAAKEN